MDKKVKEFLDDSRIEVLRGTVRRRGLRTRGGRLPPIVTRDVAAPKRTFAPTIPQRRLKTKAVEKDDKREETTKRGRETNRRGRGRGGERREFIQIAGAVFGEGLNRREVKKSSGNTSCSNDAALSVPVYKPVKFQSGNDIEDENHEFKTDNESEYDSSDEDTEKMVCLPLKKYVQERKIKTQVKTESKVNVKVELTKKIKEEIKEEEKELDELKQIQEAMKEFELKERIKSEIEKEHDIKECKETFLDEDWKFSVAEGELLFIQLPSCLPFRQPEADKEKDTTAATKKHSKQQDDVCDKIKQPTGIPLKTMSDGFLGKMQIMKSGEVRLMLGEMETRAQLEDSICFKQEAVEIENSKEPWDITILGPMTKWLLFNPIVQSSL